MQKAFFIKTVVVSLFMIFSSQNMMAQIVNVEEKRLRNKNGLMGSIDIEFNFTKDKREVIQLENNIQLGYKNGRHLYLFLNENEVIKNDNNDVLNNGYQHLRYNYSLTGFITAEVFAQYQFNQVQEIDKRILLGAGPRFGLIDKDSAKVNLGIQIMKEWEKTDEYQDNYRSSNYLSVFWQINKTISFISTTYYQPLLKNFDDYRISNESGMIFAISKRFSIEFTYEILYDTEVPDGVPETMYSFNSGIVFTF